MAAAEREETVAKYKVDGDRSRLGSLGLKEVQAIASVLAEEIRVD